MHTVIYHPYALLDTTQQTDPWLYRTDHDARMTTKGNRDEPTVKITETSNDAGLTCFGYRYSRILFFIIKQPVKSIQDLF
jgi:hypothetical protein